MKNFQKLLLLAAFVITLLFYACKKETCCGVIDVNIDIIAENSGGQNLFLSTTPGGLDPNSIKLIYKIGDDETEFYQGNLDCPRNVCYISDSGSERIVVFPNDTEKEKYPITYIQWKEGDLDTLKCHFIRKNQGSYLVCDSVWYNGKSVYPPNALNGYNRAFKIVR
jgi:hypothetical protein